MTSSRPTPPFGQVIGEAQRALRGLLDDVLAAASVSYPTWMALNYLSVQGPSVSADQLRRDLAAALRVHPSEVAELLLGLEAAGHIELRDAVSDEQASLTAGGAALYRELRDEVDGIARSALAGIPQYDIETTVNVLVRAKEQAQDLRAPVASA